MVSIDNVHLMKHVNLNSLINRIFEDHLGVLAEGVWAVPSCLTQVSLRVTFGIGSKLMKRLM